ncbi:hairy-related 5 [Cottoperca gobio]|uniref:Hairy-related 5 n=1 Tax=Cottoperca gobio TaxID=56716 RepID=A0A6J2QK09_COTGO|nr:transcription factor HES-7.1-B-like [Cottoperca gobio]
MKALTSPESPRQRSTRRVSKPVMEKRRRERINNSLETLRLLMLDNSHNDKLKNPKVEKAEILESVVNFLQTETEIGKGNRGTKRVLTRRQRPTSARQHNFHDGMRSCMLRVSHFIASQSQEADETDGDAVQSPLALPDSQTHPASPGHSQGAQATLSPHHLAHHPQNSHPSYLNQRTGLHCDTRELLASAAACTHITDPVWRPWPQ